LHDFLGAGFFFLTCFEQHKIDISIDHGDQDSFQRIPGNYTVKKPNDLASISD
jgi:hypothetical protein